MGFDGILADIENLPNLFIAPAVLPYIAEPAPVPKARGLRHGRSQLGSNRGREQRVALGYFAHRVSDLLRRCDLR